MCPAAKATVHPQSLVDPSRTRRDHIHIYTPRMT
jgi:hypothetical protein